MEKTGYVLDLKFRPEKGSKSRPRKCINGLQSRNSAIYISEGYILPYWKELSTQQLKDLVIDHTTQQSLSEEDRHEFLKLGVNL
jgi:hypothetical protein